MAFLRVDENKEELFHFLVDQLVSVEAEHGQVTSTKGDSVVCNGQRDDISGLAPCKHEETDTRLLLLAADAGKCGFNKIMLRTIDTDVLVIAIATFHELALSELWIAFGVGKHFRFVPVRIHEIASSMGQQKSRALLAFHVFPGSDQTSSFANKGKKTAWDTWAIHDEVMEAFRCLSTTPLMSALTDAFLVLERYTVFLYDRTSPCKTVNDAREDFFTRKGRDIDHIPPTGDALCQHAKRAAFLAGRFWGKCLEVSPQLPSPSEWGWVRESTQGWEPLWTTIPQVSESYQELLKCGCKSDRGCGGRCKCIRAELPCTALCNCRGHCGRS